jgi:hypothetical protein
LALINGRFVDLDEQEAETARAQNEQRSRDAVQAARDAATETAVAEEQAEQDAAREAVRHELPPIFRDSV